MKISLEKDGLKITTFDFLYDLRKERDLLISNNKENLDISDLYETDISVSFRIFKNRNTIHFYQFIIN